VSASPSAVPPPPLEDGFGLYLVLTDPVAGYVRCAEAAVEAGVRIVQLRMKRAAPEDVLRTARDLRAVTRGTRTLFVVNDDPAVSAAAGADGVHVGQGDMPVPEVRRRFPSLRLVGLSTHNPAQLAAAAAVRPDYVSLGPVNATPTKEIPDPTLGLATMAAMVAAAPCPAVCIGSFEGWNLAAAMAARLPFPDVRAVDVVAMGRTRFHGPLPGGPDDALAALSYMKMAGSSPTTSSTGIGVTSSVA